MANKIVAGDLYESITGQLFELGRQLRQPSGYPFDAALLKEYLQDAIEGKFRLPDCFRDTGELLIQIPALPRPTLGQLQSRFDWVKSIERDTSPVEAVTLRLFTILREGETSVGGAECERRIAGKLNIILGYQQAVWLVEHQDEFPEFMAMLGKIYIDFSGLVVVNSYGSRSFPFLDRSGERWYLIWNWIDDGFGSDGRVASSGK